MTLQSSKQLLSAAWIAPMDGPILRDAAILIERDRIAAVDSARTLLSAHPDAETQDLGDVIVLPGLVNAHTHLELSDAYPVENPGDLASWILQQPRSTATATESAVAITSATLEGVRQSLHFGITSIGDISKRCSLTRPLLRDGPLRVTSYGEVLAMGQRRGVLAERFAAATDDSCAGPRLRIGLTPHAPYTVEPAGYTMCLDAARRYRLPLATHLAETVDETEFLARHIGPF